VGPSVNLCTQAWDDLYLSRSHPSANHRPMIWMDKLHARFGVVPRRNGKEIAYCAPECVAVCDCAGGPLPVSGLCASGTPESGGCLGGLFGRVGPRACAGAGI